MVKSKSFYVTENDIGKIYLYQKFCTKGTLFGNLAVALYENNQAVFHD